MGRTAKQVIIWTLYAWVGIAFAYAGVLKILDLEAFVSSILTYGLFDLKQAIIISSWIPPLEILTGLGVLFKFARPGALVFLGGLLVSFLILILQAYFRGLDIDCGCFGGSSEDGNPYATLLIRDVLMLLSLVAAYCFEKRWLK